MGLGAQIFGEGTRVLGEDWEIQDLQAMTRRAGQSAQAGDGIRLTYGASASIRRLRMDGANSEGIVLSGEPGLAVGVLELTDAEVVHTTPAEGTFLSAAISVLDGGSLTMERVRGGLPRPG